MKIDQKNKKMHDKIENNKLKFSKIILKNDYEIETN